MYLRRDAFRSAWTILQEAPGWVSVCSSSERATLCRKSRSVSQQRGMCSLCAEQSLAAHVHRWAASSIPPPPFTSTNPQLCRNVQIDQVTVWRLQMVPTKTFMLWLSPWFDADVWFTHFQFNFRSTQACSESPFNPHLYVVFGLWGEEKYPERGHKRSLDVNNSLSFYDAFTSREQTVILAALLLTLFLPIRICF